jgi:hypothetical protein
LGKGWAQLLELGSTQARKGFHRPIGAKSKINIEHRNLA